MKPNTNNLKAYNNKAKTKLKWNHSACFNSLKLALLPSALAAGNVRLSSEKAPLGFGRAAISLPALFYF